MVFKSLIMAAWLSVSLNAAQQIFVENHFLTGTKNHPKVSPALMKVISLAESSGKANTIAFLAYPEQAKVINELLWRMGVAYRVNAYSDGKRYSFGVWPTQAQALQVINALRVSGIDSYDLGLVQVNSKNAKRFGWDELKLLTSLEYNVDKGAQILEGCISTNRSLETAIECYNKGSHGDYSFSYYKRVFSLAGI